MRTRRSTTCLATLPVTLLALLAALPATAQEPEGGPTGPPTRETEWVVVFKGKGIGTERVREVVKGGTRVSTSKGDLQLPGAPEFKYEQRTEVEAKTGALRSYRLTSSMITASAEPTEDGAKVEVKYMGQGGDARIKAAPPFLVLDNLVWSHFDALARMAGASGDDAFSVTALVPQRKLGVKGSFEPGETFQGKVGDQQLTLRRGQLTLASQLLVMTYDPQTGRAYRVELPASEFDCYVRGFERPPAPGDSPEEVLWREEEVELPFPLGALPGVLTLPLEAVAGPYPAVVLVHGSGPNDRDETIGPNKPFRDIARGLAKRGIASLRYDKRTLLLKNQFFEGGDAAKKAAKVLETMTLEGETISDAVAAIAWLKAREDTSRCYVAGHSLGAMAAPEIAAAASQHLAGVILLAGPGRPIDTLVREQTIYKATLAGKTKEEASAWYDEGTGKTFRQARAGELPDAARIMGATVTYWRDLFRRDDVPGALAKVKQPVLLLHGAKDYQVTLEDYGLLEAALKSREGVTYEARVFDDLNHLFMKVKGKSTGAEYMIKGKLAEEVIDAMATWIGRD